MKTIKMNLLDAVNMLIGLNDKHKQVRIEGTMSGTQIRLNKDYPTTLPLEIWGTKLHEPTVWEDLGMWNPTINDWQSNNWRVVYDNN
ncbi:hypothetical protein [Lactiplantibacillus pentosus]|uniref:hypothetical protein n=1 Tax=Lactiplantibacillus pentosus TaxID=1589 RepID=UPI0021A41B94|nr:hypothetical protein [Lactiplantibacillus pentosus]MCT3329445.1 hypothetical protein [Lactiplantibacillus pentosus]